MSIPFNRPAVTGKETQYMNQALENRKFSGDGEFTKKCHAWFEVNLPCKKALLTTSCTHALEIAAILADIQEGDEVIMPSYTFVSTANAFVLRGAKIVFVDIRPDTMNINEQLIEQAITEKTKVIVPVHYAGVACEMDSIMEIARKYNLLVIEDAAQGVMSMYHDRALGTIGHIGCYSFHETKNYHCGEGGAIILNDERFIERAEIIREKGTDRSRLFRGQVDKYTWIDIGSSYLPSELNASFLYAQLEMATEINNNRLRSWNVYYENLMPLAERRLMEIPVIPERCRHNAHMFYIKLQNSKQRADMIEMLRENEIMSIFHYIPLHGTRAGINFSRFDGEDCYTTKESERLLRLPIYYEMNKDDIQKVTDVISLFFTEERKV